jgi:hypothetical protein
MNSQKLSFLAVRLMVLYFFFQWLGYASSTIYNVVLWKKADTMPDALYELILPLAYLVFLLILLRFAAPIAEKIARGLGEIETQTSHNETQLLSILIAGVCMFVVLSSIPQFLNQLIELLEYNRRVVSLSSEKERFNRLALGLVASSIQIGLAAFCFFRARLIAVRWQKSQSPAA